jgi:hypothetical protein
MTTAAETMAAFNVECWCCGSTFAESDLIRLGQHPEVGICLGCARYLYRRRTERLDRATPSPATRLRAGIRAVRAAVVARGWPDRAGVGRFLRWIDRFLP